MWDIEMDPRQRDRFLYGALMARCRCIVEELDDQAIANTDIHRLHDVVEGDTRGRADGKTFAACHHLAGLLASSDDGTVIVWPLDRMQYLEHIMPMLSDVLNEHELDVQNPQRGILHYGNTRVYFLSRQNRQKWRGLGDYIQVDTMGE